MYVSHVSVSGYGTDIGNPKYTTFTKLVQVRNFLLPLSQSLFDMRRERHNLSMLTAFTSSALKVVSARSRLASPSSECRLSRSEAGIQLSVFSQILAHATGA